MDDQQRRDTLKEFEEAVNMTPRRFEKWLDSDDSRSAGGDDEPAGERFAQRTVRILETNTADLTDDDYEHMREVVEHVRNLLARRPRDELSRTAWRHSLMNWGHDPRRP